MQIRDDVSFDGRSVITNDEGEKEDPMAVLRRFNAERDKIQASPLLRRIDKISRKQPLRDTTLCMTQNG